MIYSEYARTHFKLKLYHEGFLNKINVTYFSCGQILSLDKFFPFCPWTICCNTNVIVAHFAMFIFRLFILLDKLLWFYSIVINILTCFPCFTSQLYRFLTVNCHSYINIRGQKSRGLFNGERPTRQRFTRAYPSKDRFAIWWNVQQFPWI